jgi:hypothetical protein
VPSPGMGGSLGWRVGWGVGAQRGGGLGVPGWGGSVGGWSADRSQEQAHQEELRSLSATHWRERIPIQR